MSEDRFCLRSAEEAEVQGYESRPCCLGSCGWIRCLSRCLISTAIKSEDLMSTVQGRTVGGVS